MKAATIAQVDAELLRQQELKRSGRFARTCEQMRDDDVLAVVLEEIAEVAEEIDGAYPEHLREELVQVIACLVAWYERPARDLSPHFSPVATRALRARVIALGRESRKLQQLPVPQTAVAAVGGRL